MRKQISTNLHANITPAEWNTIFKSALTTYKAAVWHMMTILEFGSTKFGRDTIVSMTPFDESRVNYYNAVVRVKHNNKQRLLPELVYEAIDSKNPANWLDKAIKDGLKPKQLRKLIRETEKTFKEEKQIKGKIATWPSMMVLLQNELKKLPQDQRQIAQDRMAQLMSS